MSAEQNSTENGTEFAPATIFPLVAGVDLDSYDEYESGAIDQHARCEYGARILAFGAIRRAAEIARGVENTDLFWTPFGTRKNPAFVERAEDIRRAIRAAIGSDKA